MHACFATNKLVLNEKPPNQPQILAVATALIETCFDCEIWTVARSRDDDAGQNRASFFHPTDTKKRPARLADECGAWMLSALSTHVETALGNEFSFREPFHARIHLVLRDDQHQKDKCAHKRERPKRSTSYFIACPPVLAHKRRSPWQDGTRRRKRTSTSPVNTNVRPQPAQAGAAWGLTRCRRITI